MDKIKFLSRSLLIVNILLITALVAQIIIFVISGLIDPGVVEDKMFGIFHHLIQAIQVFLLLIGLWNVQQGLQRMVRSGLYNIDTQKKSRKGGTLLILFGMVSIILNLIRISETNLSDLVGHLVQNVFTGLVGIGLLVFSEFVKNGIVLKEDVDLTI
ncbi:hypothetical protein [Reichenbachiella versicolor]|uniref:hypothetical protein n=1 Tax=Reichenbachiella versicolor TaxID=1821036 RepID=UPI000D6DD2F6|nr:hypothetical protein [Reichenbachiella versicolor]